MRSLITLLAVAVLASCGHSPPTHFFTLDPVKPDRAPKAATGAPVQIEIVHVPPELDRLSMVRERGSGELEIDDQNRWGGQLSDLVRQALAQDLAARLSPGSVILPDAPSPPATRTIAVDIVKFQPDASGTVALDASWTLLDSGSGKPVLRRPVHLTDAARAQTADAQATAMSRLLGDMADEIARALAGGVPAPTPRSAP
ncbi:MAG TPA: PqiC family protein [Alphaproteobacteria bacterium]|nr:PqiC family protein [Alphaproteobacteria bacterium]